MIRFIFITNNPELAEFAVQCGVQRVMVDLEIEGKQERQGHLDTLISQHGFDDIAPVKAAVVAAGDAELIVRLNPFSANSQAEVDRAIEQGADILMLPMFTCANEVQAFVDCVAGRVGVMPLVETKSAAEDIAAIAAIDGVTEVFIGLNDLHLDMGLKFMFEPVASGMVEAMVAMVHAAGKACGFGGIARVGEGMIPGEMVLAQHVRLGSSGVILSRTFHSRSKDLADLQSQVNLPEELSKLRAAEVELRGASEAELERIRVAFCAGVEEIAGRGP